MITGKLTQAETAFEKAIRLDPRYLDARYYLSITLIHQEKYDKAEEHLQELIKYGPRYEPAYLALAEIYRVRKEYDKGRNILEQLKRKVNNPAHAEFGLGVIEYQQGNIEEAISKWLRAIDANPDLGSAYFNLGIAYFNKNELSKAIGYLRQAIQKEPGDAEYYFYTGWFFYLSNNHDMARSSFSQMQRNCPGSKYRKIVQAINDIDNNNFERANSFLDMALKHDSDLAPAKFLKAKILEKTGDKASALSIYNELLKDDPNDRFVLESIKKLEENSGESPETITHESQETKKDILPSPWEKKDSPEENGKQPPPVNEETETQ
ncbi:MAG: tetratricopeptide repeat protein [Candidatus Eremiobacteraeota bacterium]|nr:tetratricopeptide repeat protein [Candidatus Eremiobacteraeota bacterium]